jgi:hypothetical protein
MTKGTIVGFGKPWEARRSSIDEAVFGTRMRLKSFIASLPITGPLLVRAKRALFMRKRKFTNSADYWERRYERGGNSGAGSYNRLARFKAEILNEFVKREGVRSVVELGSGDGAQLALASYPSYVGIDISPTAVEMCRKRYPHHRFFHTSEVPADLTCDLAMSLDVIYHLVEDDTFDRYMRQLFDSAGRFVAIYSSNEDKPGPASHVRHRRFTDWIALNRANFGRREHIPNPYPFDPADPDHSSFADFHFFERE